MFLYDLLCNTSTRKFSLGDVTRRFSKEGWWVGGSFAENCLRISFNLRKWMERKFTSSCWGMMSDEKWNAKCVYCNNCQEIIIVKFISISTVAFVFFFALSWRGRKTRFYFIFFSYTYDTYFFSFLVFPFFSDKKRGWMRGRKFHMSKCVHRRTFYHAHISHHDFKFKLLSKLEVFFLFLLHINSNTDLVTLSGASEWER